MGGVRNWDYRYTWMRDAAFTLYGLLRIGFTEKPPRSWAGSTPAATSRSRRVSQIVYGIDGRQDLTEETLDHLEGYRGSRPVRLGNGAYDQLQLDIYGELLDAVYLYNKHGAPISYDLWTHLRTLINWVCDNWQREDEGIWEVRGGTAPLRLLEAHVLGRHRPRPAPRGEAFLPRRPRALAPRCATRSTRRS